MSVRSLVLLFLAGANILAALWTVLSFTGARDTKATPPMLVAEPPLRREVSAAPEIMPGKPTARIGRLFDRAADRPTEIKPAVVASAASSHPRLVGVLARLDQDPQSSVAILAFGSSPGSSRLRAGERKNGWRLMAVRRTEVDIEGGDGRVVTLPLQAR